MSAQGGERVELPGDLVRRIVWTGGAFDVPHMQQELNAPYDPEATHVVLGSAAPLVVVPLDVTLSNAMRCGTTPWTGWRRLGPRFPATWPGWSGLGSPGLPDASAATAARCHDPLALAVLLDPGVVTTRAASADIELRGLLTRGRTVAPDAEDGELLQVVVPLPRARLVEVAREVDNDRLVALLLDRLSR